VPFPGLAVIDLRDGHLRIDGVGGEVALSVAGDRDVVGELIVAASTVPSELQTTRKGPRPS
jgi:hypothetical protein